MKKTIGVISLILILLASTFAATSVFANTLTLPKGADLMLNYTGGEAVFNLPTDPALRINYPPSATMMKIHLMHFGTPTAGLDFSSMLIYLYMPLTTGAAPSWCLWAHITTSHSDEAYARNLWSGIFFVEFPGKHYAPSVYYDTDNVKYVSNSVFQVERHDNNVSANLTAPQSVQLPLGNSFNIPAFSLELNGYGESFQSSTNSVLTGYYGSSNYTVTEDRMNFNATGTFVSAWNTNNPPITTSATGVVTTQGTLTFYPPPSRAYTDPTAVAWDVDASFNFTNVLMANHTYVPTDKVANPVQKLTISYDENLLTCDIKVGGVTYSLGKDFTYTGHVDSIYYSPSFANPTLGYLFPSVWSGDEATINYMYNFSGVPGGLEGTLSMLAIKNNDVTSIVSVGGTGDFKSIQVKAIISPQWFEAAKLIVHIYHNGMVSGWPHAVPTFMTTNTAVTYVQLTDYCTNVWGLQSNPYPAFSANNTKEYRIFNVVIGDKFYLGVSCAYLTSGVPNPAAKTVTLTYNTTWYLGDWYRGVAKMDQGFTGTTVVMLLNYALANTTATPPTPETYDIGPAVWNLQGFGALSGQSVIVRADGPVLPYMAKGYAILP